MTDLREETVSRTAWQDYLRTNRHRFLTDLQEFLRIPSVSTEPEHAPDVRRAASWVASRVRAAGINEVEIVETDRHPVVLARRTGMRGKPTALVYGHFDCQPADPLDSWDTAPFEPNIRDERIYARGASDDKGNMLAPIFAAEALLATTGQLPLNLILVFEGEEEVGSPSFSAFVSKHREALLCDLVVSADGNQFSEEQPHLIMGCRGLCSARVSVRTRNSDLHSGLYGGAVPNAVAVLARLLTSMHAEDGTVAVAGFYEGVHPPSDEERRAVAEAGFDQRILDMGLTAETSGDPGYTPAERAGLRPTLELNGIGGGFQGDGIKTVIPCEAHATISCRLVPDQTPERVFATLRSHVEGFRSATVDIDIVAVGGAAPPYRTPPDRDGLRQATSVLTELYGRTPVHTYAGASLPICETFLAELGAHTIFFGFSLDDEQIHAPNEFLRLASFDRAQAAYCLLYERLGAEP